MVNNPAQPNFTIIRLSGPKYSLQCSKPNTLLFNFFFFFLILILIFYEFHNHSGNHIPFSSYEKREKKKTCSYLYRVNPAPLRASRMLGGKFIN